MANPDSKVSELPADGDVSASRKGNLPVDLREVERRLRNSYGQPRHQNPRAPLDDLIFIMLSRMTQETKFVRSYRALVEAYPTWDRLRDAPLSEVVERIRDAGLAPTKARHFQEILKEVTAREGRTDLSRLANLSTDDAEAYLTSLPGVSRKTARCVLLYALDRDVCPVDTHVWRVMQRLGAAPPGRWSERTARELEERIPEDLRASLHITLISHGRAVCRARVPRCPECALFDLCLSSQD